MQSAVTIDPESEALLNLRELEMARGYRQKPSRLDVPKIGAALTSALEAAAESVSLIPDEQDRLRDLLAEETAQGLDKNWLDGREYQIWLVGQQLTRAAELANERLTYLSRIRTPGQVKAEEELCGADKHHWFRYYAWGFDPRPDSPLNRIPIAPFDFQARYLDWLDHLVFRTRQGGVVPKSRDMGATEWALRWAIYYWKYRDTFQALLLSRTEDEVDSKKDVNTLFEKVRFQIRLFPEWMLPEGFDMNRGMPYMLIENPENASAFHGRAPTENVGRQLRVAVVLYDEKAFAPNGGYKQHTSLSQTSKSLVDISSVAGRLNKFADRMLDGKTPQFVMDWRDHPWKTPEWYNALQTGVFGTAMTAQEIAQEIDRDLDASQPGKVWSHREEYVFMTWREVVGAFEKFGFAERFYDSQRRYQIPREWRWARYHDYGQTAGHEWAYALAARPTKFFPFHDTIFVFLALELKPTGLTQEQAVALWRGYEQDVGVRDFENKLFKEPWSSKNSHEQKDLRKVLYDEYGETWDAWAADEGYTKGIPQVQVWFNVIEANKPNPFRPDLNGRSRIIFVAPDSEYGLAFNQQNGSHYLTNSKTERGFATLRKQIPAYHYPEEERGKDVKKMRPAKQFDDIVDTLRAIAVDEVNAEDMTEAEEIETQMPEHLKQSAIAQHFGKDGFVELNLARQQEEKQIKIRAEAAEREQDERVQQHFGTGGVRNKLLGKRRR
jgi:hypothetical protein